MPGKPVKRLSHSLGFALNRIKTSLFWCPDRLLISIIEKIAVSITQASHKSIENANLLRKILWNSRGKYTRTFARPPPGMLSLGNFRSKKHPLLALEARPEVPRRLLRDDESSITEGGACTVLRMLGVYISPGLASLIDIGEERYRESFRLRAGPKKIKLTPVTRYNSRRNPAPSAGLPRIGARGTIPSLAAAAQSTSPATSCQPPSGAAPATLEASMRTCILTPGRRRSRAQARQVHHRARTPPRPAYMCRRTPQPHTSTGMPIGRTVTRR